MDKALFRCRRTGHAARTAGSRAHALIDSRADTVHIVIAYGDWTVETSLALAVAAILLAFLALHDLIRLWGGLRAVPYRLRRGRRHRRNAKVQHTYQRGMIALAEGHWQEAEKWLLKHVHH